jgi:hypothetical protein
MLWLMVSRFAGSALVAYCHEVDRVKAEEEAKKKEDEERLLAASTSKVRGHERSWGVERRK